MSSSSASETQRIEAFCDGVYAIAITLLILEIKVPPIDTIHSVNDLWKALGHLWPSVYAFSLSFMIILISWVNHHGVFKLVDKTSPQFLFANGFFLLTIVVLPYPTMLVAQYLNTPYAEPAIDLFCLCTLFHNIGWDVLFLSCFKPKLLAKNEETKLMLKESFTQCLYGTAVYITMCILLIWFPMTAYIINNVLWFVWLIKGVLANK